MTKNNSQGIIFVIISCQRVILSEEFPWLARNLVIRVFPSFFQGFKGFDREGISLVNLGVFPNKGRKIKERKDRDMTLRRALRITLPLQNPGDQLQKCRSPEQEKCQKSASESAGPKRGAEESAEKVLRASSLIIGSTEARSPKHFFGTFLGTPFGAGTFRSTFRHFSCSGLRHFCSWSPGL